MQKTRLKATCTFVTLTLGAAFSLASADVPLLEAHYQAARAAVKTS